LAELTPQQATVFAAVCHYYESVGRPAPAAYVAEKLSITRQRVGDYFIRLNELGYLRASGSPAVPARPMPRHDPLTKQQLPNGLEKVDGVGVKARVVPMPPLSFRAEVSAQSVDDAARTVELIFSTGAGVERYDWMNDTSYLETLSLDPAHVRIDRLNAGGPLLDAHSDWSLADILGTVVPGSVSLAKKQARCTVRFSKREAVEPIWQDVKDGIIRSVSVGYRTYRFEETPPSKNNAMPVRLCTDWEPFEVSMVPIPADAGAMVRGKERPKVDFNPCQIVTRKLEENKMENGEQLSETIVADPLPPAPTTTPAPATEPNERDQGVSAERERAQGILLASRAARLPQLFADKLIAEGTPLVKAQTQIFVELQKRGDDGVGPGRVPSGGGAGPIVGDDPLVHLRKGIENALLHRVAHDIKKPDGTLAFPLTEQGRKYRGMSMLDIARVYLQARGIRTTDISKMELAGHALGLTSRGGMHTTSDFALLLADVASKTLREAYAEAPQTFAPITRRVTLTDFKPSARLQIGDAPALLEVKEHGEFTRGTIAEGKETLQLKTFGRVFAITRQALVNDDTDAFSRVATMFGRSARTLESDLAWAQITSNPVMGDGVVLFHATHGNLDAVASVISVASLGKGRAAMRIQKGLDGTTVLNVNPKFLGLPAALETTAATFLVQITPAQPSNVNPFAGVLEPIVEPRLDASSVTAWYLFASGFDLIEMATLEGEGGPMVESRIGFDIDGLEIKARHDVAAKVIDWRGAWKNPGV